MKLLGNMCTAANKVAKLSICFLLIVRQRKGKVNNVYIKILHMKKLEKEQNQKQIYLAKQYLNN